MKYFLETVDGKEGVRFETESDEEAKLLKTILSDILKKVDYDLYLVNTDDISKR